MQRTAKGIVVDVVAIINGKPEVLKDTTFALTKKEDVEKAAKRKGWLVIWDSAKEFTRTYHMDDDFFFLNAKIVYESSSGTADDGNDK